MGNIRFSLLAGSTTRNTALLVLIAILVSNLLCELGNLLAGRLQLDPHFFNKWFLVAGLVGVAGFGFALFSRRGVDDNTSVDKLSGRRTK